MRRRLLMSTVGITVTVLLMLAVPIAFLIRRVARDEELSRLQREGETLLATASTEVERAGSVLPDRLNRILPTDVNAQITLPSGRKVQLGRPIEGAILQVDVPGSDGLVARMRTSDGPVRDRIMTALEVLFGFSLLGVLAATILSLVQARRLTRPVQILAGSADRLGSGDFSVTAPRSGIAELDVLAAAFDSSAARIGQLVDAERSFNTNASHQLRSALTGLRLHIEELTHSSDPAARAEAEVALEAADKLKNTVEEMLRLSRTGRAGVATTFDLIRLARDHASDFVPQLQVARRTLTVAPGPPVLVDASPGAVGQILDVLLSNSVQHGGGAVTIGVAEWEGWAQLLISDQGPGIDPDVVDELFTAKPAGRTHGLGLPLAVTLATSEGGQLDLASTRPTTFRLRLPLHLES